MWNLLTNLTDYLFVMGYLYAAYIIVLACTDSLTKRGRR